MQQTCEVCELLDNDKSVKDCIYCHFCKAWICIPDQTNWDRRAKAATKKMMSALSSTAEQPPD